MKKFISLIILAALILSFAACGSDGGKGKPQDTRTDTTAVSDTSSEIEGDYEPLGLPELDYGGETIRILTEYENEYYCVDDNGNDYENIYAGELTVEELNNEPVNDAVYNRELYVEELLNVDIERIQTPKDKCVRQYVELMHSSGDIAAEIVTAPCAGTMWSSQFGYYRDLYEVSTLALGAPWWSQDFNAESSFGGKLYFASGDMSLTLLRTLYIIFFNKDLAEDNGIDGVYDLVFDGGWTIDALTELSTKVYKDVNGNSEVDSEDTFGFMGASMTTDALWSAFEIDICSKDEDDYLVYTPDLEKFGIAHEKLLRLYKSKSTFTDDMENPSGLYGYFAEGKALFTSCILGKVETEKMRNMQYDYGILPVPKFNREQSGYYTTPHDQYTVFALCSTLSDEQAEMAGAVLEAMAWYSYSHVKPTYLNVAMKGKYANDQETRRMLDIVTNGFRIDAGWIYAYYLSDYPQTWRRLIAELDENYTSAYATKERNIKICMKGLNDAYRALAEG